MRYLIYSDVHANIDALNAVLRSVRRKRIDAAISLGDLVGYGAAPNQVLDLVRQMRGEFHHIRGNHDKVVAGIEEGLGFNSVALAAARWTRERLAPANQSFLRALPQGPAREDGFDYCHGSPLDEDAYVFTAREALDVFRGAEFELCFFGHTHVAGCYAYGPDGLEEIPIDHPRATLELVPGVRYLVNPGAVGQPRDRDPRAAFILYDSDRRLVMWLRVDYPISRAQGRILKAGLPKVLADRLSRGA